eukprot:scaffold4024_cov208-Skeletonema_marinoi.AAC.1
MDHQQEDEADDQQLCDDGSILISACQSAVTHFFGHDVPEQPTQFDNDNGGGEVMGSPSEDDRSSPSKQQQLSSAATSITLPSSSSNNSLFNNSNLLLYSRARSMSPSLSTDTPLLLTCDPTILQNSNYYYESYISGGGGSEESDYWTTSGYFETSDFTAQTWLNVLQETETIRYCGAGAAILTAVIIIHPLALIGAAATAAVGASAAWAVGQFHDLDTGYQIWNHEDFGMLFWEEQTVAVMDDSLDGVDTNTNITNNHTAAATAATTTAAIATLGSQQIIQQNEEGLRRAFLLEQEKMMQRNNALFKEEEAEESENDVQQHDDRDMITMPQHQQRQQQQRQRQTNVEKKLQSISLDETNRLIRVNSAPVKETSLSSQPRIKSSPGRSSKQQPQHLLPPRQQNKATQHPTTLPPSILSTQQSLDRHYPPLEIRVVNQVQFHGLNTCEFFQVFFSDDAPYSMKEFQQKRGDVDIVYGSWNDVTDIQNMSSFQSGLLPLPPNSTRERTLTFNTLTKSYFGPAYAKATKIQRATQLSKHLLVIENQTQLSEVPFSDRFKVLERWVVEAVKNRNDGNGGRGGGGLYTCKLTVHAEVIMISHCRFEPQIRKKAAETFTDLTTGWCKLATKALEATKEQKRKRLRNEEQHLFNDGTDTVVDDTSARRQIRSKKSRGATTESELFAKHQKKFQELDDLISHGDGGIEVMHSTKAGAHSAFAEVLESPSSSSTSASGLLKLRDGTVVKVARRRGGRGTSPFSRTPRKTNRRSLLRKLSSRVVSFSKQAR